MELLTAFIIIAAVTLFSAQPVSDRVILIPDADGNVGEIIVSNQAGTQILDQPYMSVESKGNSRLDAPEQLDRDSVINNFKEVLASIPHPASRYILYFKTGTTELTDESRQMLDKISADVNSRQNYDVFIDGHTDTMGATERNYNLALERAQEVNLLFSEQLSKPEKVRVTSHGDGNLLINTADEVDEPRNRRVEILIH